MNRVVVSVAFLVSVAVADSRLPELARRQIGVTVEYDPAYVSLEYPGRWGLKGPDKNIDHRRVPNLQTFFKRRGWHLPVTQNAADYKPGDLVTCLLGDYLPHIMIVSDRKSEAGTPLIIHNIGAGTEEEDCLFAFPMTGHYRVNLSLQGKVGRFPRGAKVHDMDAAVWVLC